MHERRSVSEQNLLLGKGRLHHRPFGRGLHIAQSAVDELGRARGRAGAKVLRVQNEHAVAAAGGIHGNPEARCSGSDDDGIKVGRLGNRLEGGFTILGMNGAGGALCGLSHNSIHKGENRREV